MNDLRRARILGRRPTRARTTDIRARQARRKELKRLLREVLPHHLPEVLIPKILTWVGYDLIEGKPTKPRRHSWPGPRRRPNRYAVPSCGSLTLEA